ncbi:Transcriptional regulatory protein, C terminal [Streptomyces sp. 3213]|uniref:BTAD domain-containing putative transcriptional regulator n=1 Tax=Streptomyces sp. 3213.3 TaxID=1855348 RepID=UPI0008981E2A|nr:BTAD domain-containing putative transcriptional regulator [Streptomyces sp. 3213.3]SEE85728.1 Transcriptional regulatory protein, C terminal [Streptomyces sp. 3213] [Streptomyces sp. 3213.3]
MLRIRVLGSLGADDEGRPVELGAPRQRAVLALLIAARGTVVSVDRISDALWRGAPPNRATVSLHTYVSHLRRALEPGRPPRTPATVLVTAPPGYALRLPEDAVDAWRFETWVARARSAPAEEARALLAEALAWWQGPAFAEHADEAWAEPEATRLTALRAEARELAVAADLRTGRPAEAVPAAELLVRESPLREEGWRLLALAQWACGRQADALAALRAATRVLREELGCAPGPALTELEQAVLNGRLDVLRAQVPHRGEPQAEPSASVARHGEHRPSTGEFGGGTGLVPTHSGEPRAGAGLFVGRDSELRAVETAARAARRRGGVVLVTGEAGVGKSALLGRVEGRLRSAGWTVVVGRCPQSEGAPPAWAWAEALGALARELPPTRPDELAVLLREQDSAAVATRDEATAGRFRMHRAFAAWLRAAAGEFPLAVILEDLHRADGETLALLEAAATVTGVPLLTVASYRPAETGEDLGKTLAHLAPVAPRRVALTGLAPHDVATVVDAVCGEPVDAWTVTALAERTGGNPFYVLESARLLASEGALVAVSEVPQGVRDVLRRRLALLPAAARAALRLTAVVGLEADAAVLVDAADTDEDTVLEGLDAALAADLLTESGPGRVRFVHALVRDTVYTDLSGVRRARLHARVAHALRRHRPHELAALAHHFAHSGSTAHAPLAVDYALRAAEAAERRYAHDVAVDLIQQAIETRTASDGPAQLEDTVGLLVRLLGAQVRAGSTDAARRTRQRAVELAEQADRGDLVAAVYGAWTEPSPWRSRLEGFSDRTTLERLERLAADPTLDDPTRARVLQVYVEAVAAENAPHALEAARTQLELARANGEPRLLAAALMTSARLLPLETQATARTPLVAELRRLAHAHDLPAYRWVPEHLDGMTAGTLNDPAAVRRHTERGLELAHRYRMVWAQGLGVATSAMLATVAGRFDAAEAGYAEADVLLRRVGSHHARGLRTLGLTTIRLAQDRVAEIEPVMRRVYETVGAPCGVALALILARLGRLEESLAVHCPPEPVTDHLYGLELDFRAQLAVLHGDVDLASALVPQLLPVRDQLAGAAGAAYATRPLAHALADLYRLLGEDGPAADHYTLAEHTALAWGSTHLADRAREATAALAAARARRRTFVT